MTLPCTTPLADAVAGDSTRAADGAGALAASLLSLGFLEERSVEFVAGRGTTFATSGACCCGAACCCAPSFATGGGVDCADDFATSAACCFDGCADCCGGI